MTRYWAFRTDQARRPFFWQELQDGRLRQGWGYLSELDLEILDAVKRGGGKFAKYQRDAWRNRRLLPTQPGSMQIGDIVVLLHLPERGLWSIARITGGYRYEISRQPNVFGQPDYGHIRDAELLRGRIDPGLTGVSDELRRSMRPMTRMWSLDRHAKEIESLLTASQTANG